LTKRRFSERFKSFKPLAHLKSITMELNLTGFIPLKDYEQYYLIHPNGSIYSKRLERLLNRKRNKLGKTYVGLTKGGRKREILLSELLTSTFPKPRPEGLIIKEILSKKTRTIFSKSQGSSDTTKVTGWRPI
jgi:hypothetical protein